MTTAMPALASGIPTASRCRAPRSRARTSPSVRPSEAITRDSVPITTSDSPPASASIPTPSVTTASGRGCGGSGVATPPGDATNRGGGGGGPAGAVAAPTSSDSTAWAVADTRSRIAWRPEWRAGFSPRAGLGRRHAMGRTFENRRLQILKRGDRDAKAFTRAGRQISMAVKAGGSDPDGNAALRRAIQNARAANMPKDRIQNAIDKALGVAGAADYQEVLYEGYGPHGIPLLVLTATDNPTRTVANLRFTFKKGNGNLGNSGSVAFMFDHFMVFRVAPEGIDRDELELEMIEHGLEALVDGQDDDGKPLLLLRCVRENFGTLQSALEAKKIAVVSSGQQWVAKTPTELGEKEADEVLELIDKLEQDDDIQEVFHNLE